MEKTKFHEEVEGDDDWKDKKEKKLKGERIEPGIEGNNRTVKSGDSNSRQLILSWQKVMTEKTATGEKPANLGGNSTCSLLFYYLTYIFTICHII